MTARLLFFSLFLAVLHAEAAGPVQSPELAPRETEDGVVFQCYAPQAQAVHVAGDFNGFLQNVNGEIGRNHPSMSGPDYNGVFRTVIPLPPGVYRYKFALDFGRGGWFAPSYAQRRDEDENAYLVIDGVPDEGSGKKAAQAPHAAPGGITFEVEAPDAHIVFLAGTFNRWANNNNGRVTELRFAMRGPDEQGIWRMTLPLGRGRHEYQFVINGETWIADPLASTVTPDQHAVLEVP